MFSMNLLLLLLLSMNKLNIIFSDIADLVQNGKNGWLVSPGDESAFATRVIEVLDMEPRRREEISDAARLTVMENFRNTVIADRFIALYNRIKV